MHSTALDRCEPAAIQRHASRATWFIGWAAGVALLCGCASSGYTPGTLPPDLCAQPIRNAQTVDLSKFAGPPTSNDMIGPGDVIEVSLAAGLDPDALSRFLVRVGDDGRALLPEIGALPLAGLDLMQAEQQIINACVHRGLYRQPHVTVSMRRPRTNRVTVVGAVEEPGIHELPRGSSYLLSAIVAAGGLAEDAGTQVEIRHPGGGGRLATPPGYPGASPVQPVGYTTPAGPTYVCLDMAVAVQHGSQGNYLDDGSVVTIERRQPPPVQVLGLVRTPQEIEYPVNHDLRLLGALAQAGGTSSKVADKVLVLRQRADGKQAAQIRVSLRRAKNIPGENLRLAPGDVVIIKQTLSTVGMDLVTNVVRLGVGANVPLF
jgi:polysaccharide biosynthesis/export protein